MAIERVDAYLEAHRGDFEEQLKALLRIPSISAQPDHNADTRRAAEFLRDDLQAMGLSRCSTDRDGGASRSSMPRGRRFPVEADRPDLWPLRCPARPNRSNPGPPPRSSRSSATGTLSPEARPTTKGRCSRTSKRPKPGFKAGGGLPVNVKFLIEGEEEVGGKNLEAYVAANHATKLACDYAVISDTSQFAPGIPAITYGLKGLAYFELDGQGGEVRPPLGDVRRDGGQPAQRPGHDPGELEGAGRSDSRSKGFTTRSVLSRPGSGPSSPSCRSPRPTFSSQVGAPSLEGEVGYTTLERRWARPTCDVNGIFGGYQGPGPKTVLPVASRGEAELPARPRPGTRTGRRPVPGPCREGDTSGRDRTR